MAHRSPRPAAAVWLVLWALAGIASALALFGVFTIGPLALVAAAVLVVPLALTNRARPWAGALLIGPGLVFLATAWHDRSGPVTTCTATYTDVAGTTAIGQLCRETPSPIPEVAIGLALLAAGAALIAWSVRRSRSAPAVEVPT